MAPSMTVGLLWLLFGGAHVDLATRALRERLARRLGETGFIGLYFAVASASFADAFWFGLFGPALVLFGWLTSHALVRDDRALPTFVGWFLVGTPLAGCVVMPVSGFWLVLTIGRLVLRVVAPRPCNAAERPL